MLDLLDLEDYKVKMVLKVKKVILETLDLKVKKVFKDLQDQKEIQVNVVDL